MARIQSPHRSHPARATHRRRLMRMIALAGIAAIAPPRRPSFAAANLAEQEVSIATKDGLLTATFSERTDDSILNASIPALAEAGVQAVSLRGAPVRDMRSFTPLASRYALDVAVMELSR